MRASHLFADDSLGRRGLNKLFVMPDRRKVTHYTYPLDQAQRQSLARLAEHLEPATYKYVQSGGTQYLYSVDSPAISGSLGDIWMDYGLIHRNIAPGATEHLPAVITYGTRNGSLADKKLCELPEPDWRPIRLPGSLITSLHWYEAGLATNSNELGVAILTKTARHRYTLGVWQDDPRTGRPASEYDLGDDLVQLLLSVCRKEYCKTYLGDPIYVRATHGIPGCDSDQPSFGWCDGTLAYLRDGVLHRRTGPAVIYRDGLAEYYLHGVFQGCE